MPIFILTWNPTKWPIADDEYARQVERCAKGTHDVDRWSVGNRTGGIGAGDYGILLRQHDSRGIVAAGVFTDGVFQDRHWDGSSNYANYAPIKWGTWLPVGDRLTVEELKDGVPGVTWDRLQSSGTEMVQDAAVAFDAVWAEHLDRLGLRPFTSTEELAPAETYKEGAKTRIEVNRYERDPRARAEALRLHGSVCNVCSFDFGAFYGPDAQGFIHIHHTREVSDLGADYRVNPATDLVPVCPNCHAMLHRTRPAILPEDLQKQLARQPRG